MDVFYHLPKQNDSTIHSSSEVSDGNIKSYITSLSSYKAITDHLPLRIIKAILPIILPSLAHIVNLSLSTGQFPELCKQAVVTHIFKGGNSCEPNDYRPISILPIVSKCIEFSVNEQYIVRIFRKQQIFENKQQTFNRSSIWIWTHSCEHVHFLPFLFPILISP